MESLGEEKERRRKDKRRRGRRSQRVTEMDDAVGGDGGLFAVGERGRQGGEGCCILLLVDVTNEISSARPDASIM